MQRLGGSSFTQEIIALKEMPISVSQKAEYLQCIRIQNRLTDVEEKLVELTDKFRILEAQQNYTLPKHIRGKYYFTKLYKIEHRRRLHATDKHKIM